MLAGCAARAPLPNPSATELGLASDWPTRREQLTAFDEFALSGRVAVAAAEQGFSAGLRWQQRAQRGAIVLEGPFGVGALAIDTDGDSLRVTTGRGEQFDGAAARAALEQQLGFALPLEALRYWVRGLPAPFAPIPPAEAVAVDAAVGTPQETIDSVLPRLRRLQQHGWVIDYAEYQPAPFDHQPRRLVVQNGGARLRLFIDSWGIRSATEAQR
jgi:outer membrane lipoprotein LolB